MYQRILVPMDGSAVAAQVLPYAHAIAKATGAKITLLQVVSPFPRELMRAANRSYAEARPSYPPTLEQWTKVQADRLHTAQQYLEDTARPLRQAGLQVSVDVVEDEPANGITKAAKQRPGTLIAMTTHGRSGLGRWVLGSVTDKVVRTSEQPVLVITAHEKPAPVPGIKRILLPLDGTETSEAALPHAVAMAKALGAGVTLLRSISPLAYGDTFADYVPGMYEDLSTEIDSEVRGYLQQIADRLRAEGISDVEELALDGYPANTIIDTAGTEGDKLVVMATHGRSGLERWVLGSVTDRVVRHGSAPVFVVRPEVP